MSAGDATKAPNLVRVRLARNGRSLDCDCPALGLRPGDQVVVDDRRGGGLATVMVSPGGRAGGGECGRLIRKAEPRDLARAAHEQKRQQEALTFGRERARALRLPIKLFRAEIAQGSDRATFFFSCDQRVDFRALVRDLAAYLHVRVEMRQVGVRDEARLTGGLGSCGRELCCSSHLRHFAPVSIKMAKHQHLVLNPTKIAGQCGRLKCCLGYEDELYLELSKGLPKVGKRVETPEGTGRVEDLDVLAGKIRVSLPERPSMTFAASEVRLIPSAGEGKSAGAKAQEPGRTGPTGPADEGEEGGDGGGDDEEPEGLC